MSLLSWYPTVYGSCLTLSIAQKMDCKANIAMNTHSLNRLPTNVLGDTDINGAVLGVILRGNGDLIL